ncbi:MAG: molybdenum cofactor guanylyltransferase [Acidobacteriota bacterium]
MSQEPRPVGVALAGGASRRMGRDKATLPLPDSARGHDLLSWTVDRLRSVCPDVVVADGGRGLGADLGVPSLEDGPGRGPAAGILGAHRAFPRRALLVLACDLPLVPVELLRELASADAGPAWVVPARGGRLEPLCALYRPRALVGLDARVHRRRFDLQGLRGVLGADVRVLDAEARESPEEAASAFLNVNRPEDLETLAAARRDCLRRGSSSR